MPSNPDLLNIELVLEEYLEQIRQSITDNKIEVDNKEVVAAINRLPMFPSAEQIARELSKVITIPQPIDFTPTLTEVMEAIIGLKRTIRDVAGGGRNLNGGTGIVRMEEGQVVEVANDTGNPLATSVSNFPATQAVTSSTLATEATLDAIRDYFLAPRPMLYATASVPTSTWTTVLTYTPTTNIHIFGLNAERTGGITNITYRFRLLLDGTVKFEEGVNVNANSWMQMEMDAAAGQVITIQAFHGEVTAQDFNASLQVRNLA